MKWIKREVLKGLSDSRGPKGGWGEGHFIFMELGSTGNYFRGAGEQANVLNVNVVSM